MGEEGNFIPVQTRKIVITYSPYIGQTITKTKQNKTFLLHSLHQVCYCVHGTTKSSLLHFKNAFQYYTLTVVQDFDGSM